jgi:centromere protein S
MASVDADKEEVHAPPNRQCCIHFANTKQRLKSALWYSIGQYIDEECLTSDLNATPQFIGALTELVYTQIGMSPLHPPSPLSTPHHIPSYNKPRSYLVPRSYFAPAANTSHDLEVFAAHGGRKTITTDDVMLLTRRNDALETMLRRELEGMKKAEVPVSVPKKRGRPSGGKGKA